MAIKGDYEFLFFGKDDNSFLENYSYDLFQEHGDKSGQIFVTLEIQNNPVDAEEIGGVLFETMQKVFFEEMDKDPYDRFEASLKAVNSILNEFRNQKTSAYIGNLNVIIAAIVGDALYLTQSGDAEAYLVRNRYVSNVSEGLSDDDSSEDVFSSIASGSIEPGDFVLFSSTRLLRYISKTDFAKAVNKRSIIETLNEVKDVMSTEILGRVGMTGILFSKVTSSDVESINDDVDFAAKNVLEATSSHVSGRKETMTGRFFTALKGLRPKKKNNEVFREDGVFASGGNKIADYISGFFSNGFGRDKILAILIGVILLLLIGIWVVDSRRAAREEIQRLDEVLISVQNKISEAETKGAYDKEKAKEILDQAYLDSMTVLNSGQYRDKAKVYLIKIDETRDALDNVKRISTPRVFADLSTKRSDVNALGFSLVSDRVFVYEYNALYELVLDQVQDPLTIDDNETIIAATGFEDRKSIVFLTKSGKLIEYRNGTFAFMDTADGSFHKGVTIADWSNKIYLLDTAGNQLWKYTYKGTTNRFGSAEPYFTGEIDLSNSKSFAIDSSIYVLNANGDIDKYYGGTKAEFYINNPPFSSLNNPTVIYTADNLNEIYVLDSKDAKVFVYAKDSKTGNLVYRNQYLLDGVGELRDLYVDNESKKLYVLSADKVYEVDM